MTIPERMVDHEAENQNRGIQDMTMKVLIYGGTTEGRRLAEILHASGIEPVVSVATEYGEEIMEDADPEIRVRTGRMDCEEMRQLAASENFCAVVDATHPYATEVSRNIRESVKGIGIPLFRLSRAGETCFIETDTTVQEKRREFQNLRDCIEVLSGTEGNVFLTTGSKELKEFCRDDRLRERLIVRVLPGEESLRLCREAGLSGRQIIAMQGPFSVEMNLAVIHQYDIRILVTKESGHTGGADAKMKAAAEAGISCYVIRRPPEENGTEGLSLEETLRKLSETTGISIQNPVSESAGSGKVQIILAGTGMGTEATLTEEVTTAVKQADYLFGAERMIHAIAAPSCKAGYALYRPDEVTSKIQEIMEKDPDAYIVILFSGDSGFYSGAAGMRRALMSAGFPEKQIRTLPGISALSYLSAAAGIPWEDAGLVSLHGIPEEQWRRKLSGLLDIYGKIFFLTSGAADVRKLGKFLKTRPEGNETRLILGYQLSYPEEKILHCSPQECMSVEAEGLYAGFILQNSPEENTAGSDGRVCRSETSDGRAAAERHSICRLTPGIRDEQFIRGKVPMTKEEIRELCICKLHLRRGSVLYDIGSGTGAVAVEAALLPGMGDVIAIEQNPEGVLLIRENAEKFGASNIHVIEGMAPGVLEQPGLPAPTHAFIGGTMGHLQAILETLQRMNSRMRVVVTAVTLETIRDIQNALETFRVEEEDIAAVSVSKAKETGHYHLMQAANTVYIFSFSFEKRIP